MKTCFIIPQGAEGGFENGLLFFWGRGNQQRVK